jgi:hypothetical protein
MKKKEFTADFTNARDHEGANPAVATNIPLMVRL